MVGKPQRIFCQRFLRRLPIGVIDLSPRISLLIRPLIHAPHAETEKINIKALPRPAIFLERHAHLSNLSYMFSSISQAKSLLKHLNPNLFTRTTSPSRFARTMSVRRASYLLSIIPVVLLAILLRQYWQTGNEHKITDWVDPKDQTGEFKRGQSSFRNFISKEPGSEFPPEKGRYHLYVSYACPWGTLISLESVN